jgi:hypothetical protein
VVRDEGVSGVAAWKPGLERAVQQAQAGQIVGVILINNNHLASGESAVARLLGRLRSAAWTDQVQP